MNDLLGALAEYWTVTPAPVKGFVAGASGIVSVAWINSRSQTKRRIIDELTALRVAQTLCFTTVNAALLIKAQQIVDIKQRYDAALDIFTKYQSNPVGPLNLRFDFRTLQKLNFETDALAKLVTEKATMMGARGIALCITLAGTAKDFNLSIEYRNSLCAEYRRDIASKTMAERIAFYLGANSGWGIDERFRNNVDSLALQVDHILYFGIELEKELIAYALRRRRAFAWRYRIPVPKMEPSDWTKAQKQNLFPDPTEYDGWVTGFKKPATWQGKVLNFIRTKWRAVTGR